MFLTDQIKKNKYIYLKKKKVYYQAVAKGVEVWPSVMVT